MKQNILSQYYKGILQQLNSEVQLINQLFNHSGIKGEGNETAIRDLIVRFLPKKYAVGSGIVIDRYGNKSRQCDIIIYDNHNYPELLSMSTSKFYPVDLVYAVIEVKTKLDSEKSKIAIQNIDSVLKLEYIKERFRVSPTEPIHEINLYTKLFIEEHTKPPLGLIFAYETETNCLNTFLNWFSKQNSKDFENTPNNVCSLDQGILVFKNSKPEIFPLVFPISDGIDFQTTNKNNPTEINGRKLCFYNESYFPYTKIGTEEVLVDQGKTLLNFILILTKMLQKRYINPNLDLMEYYLTDDLKIKFSEENGELIVL